MIRPGLVLALTFGIALPCATGCRTPSLSGQFEVVDSPAPAGSSLPFLAARDDRLYMTWIAPDGTGSTALRVASLADGRWSDPRTIATHERMLVNWADFPAIAVASDGLLAAHWLVRSTGKSFAYDAWFSTSTDGGRSWAEPVRLHDDGTATEHGFVTELAGPDGSVGLAWLDGRAMEGGESRMQLMYRRWDPDGFGPEVVLDSDVCTCCQTSGVRTDDALLVVYRDHEAGEIRDISLVRGEDDGWTAPRTIHRDGWEIGGCPVNGPAIDARGDDVAIAWYTEAANRPAVWVGFSDDLGLEFDEPVRVDDGNPIGRVDIEMLEDGSALVSWIEEAGEGAEIRVRRIRPGQPAGAAAFAGLIAAGRSSGFPRMARSGSLVYVAWTDPGPPTHVRLSVLSGP